MDRVYRWYHDVLKLIQYPTTGRRWGTCHRFAPAVTSPNRDRDSRPSCRGPTTTARGRNPASSGGTGRRAVRCRPRATWLPMRRRRRATAGRLPARTCTRPRRPHPAARHRPRSRRRTLPRPPRRPGRSHRAIPRRCRRARRPTPPWTSRRTRRGPTPARARHRTRSRRPVPETAAQRRRTTWTGPATARRPTKRRRGRPSRRPSRCCH